MRKPLLLFTIFLFALVVANAQRADTLPSGYRTFKMYSTYTKKHSTYKAIGWGLLGSGAALFGTAYFINVSNGWNGPTKGEGLFTAGIISAALSPVFFVLSGVNKHKAKLLLKGEHATSLIINGKAFYPSVSLQVNF